MSYYPTNFYSNYPQYNQPMQMQQPQNMFYQQSQSQTLQGKIVDSEDMVKATDVPIGGYGIFPKADLSEVYIKTWNNNGTTSILTFKPVIVQKEEEEPKINNSSLYDKMQQLEQKLDDFISFTNNNNINANNNNNNNNSSTALKRKEL